jgi:hypothetical protein
MMLRARSAQRAVAASRARPPIRRTARGAVTAPSDAKLLALGKRAAELQAKLHAFEDDPRDDVPEMAGALDAQARLLTRIAATPARTIAGMRVKAERVIEARKDIPADIADDEDTDVVLSLSIVRDLLAIKPATG